MRILMSAKSKPHAKDRINTATTPEEVTNVGTLDALQATTEMDNTRTDARDGIGDVGQTTFFV